MEKRIIQLADYLVGDFVITDFKQVKVGIIGTKYQKQSKVLVTVFDFNLNEVREMHRNILIKGKFTPTPEEAVMIIPFIASGVYSGVYNET